MRWRIAQAAHKFDRLLGRLKHRRLLRCGLVVGAALAAASRVALVVTVTVTVTTAATASTASIAARGVVAAFIRGAGVYCHVACLRIVNLPWRAEITAWCGRVCASLGLGTARWALVYTLVDALTCAL